MLQQTQVATVIPYYERWLERFPTIQSLAAAEQDEVLKYWAGLGYYSRARNLHSSAQQIVQQRGGKFPGSAEEWMQLPGIGRYTAGAICSIAQRQRQPILDGNARRVLSRWFALRAQPSPRTTAKLWQLAEQVMPKNNCGDFNQAMMELGATICRPREPHCDTCPVTRYCQAFQQKIVQKIPVKKSTRSTPTVHLICVAITHRHRMLIRRRPPRGLWGGLWELPTHPVSARQDRTEAWQQLWQELWTGNNAQQPEVNWYDSRVRHQLTHRTIELTIGRVNMTSWTNKTPVTSARWIKPAERNDYALSRVMSKIWDWVVL
ncbi:MAG: Adenine DNA glycosylase [Phycisphaerae bacterium]|nr:Adenine DNA glycosylase [Phycisphaerae bacterium]